MPLFFIIAAVAGGLTLGATTADVAGVPNHNAYLRAAAKAQQTNFQASAYGSYEDCVRAAAQQNLPASVCLRV